MRYLSGHVYLLTRYYVSPFRPVSVVSELYVEIEVIFRVGRKLVGHSERNRDGHSLARGAGYVKISGVYHLAVAQKLVNYIEFRKVNVAEFIVNRYFPRFYSRHCRREPDALKDIFCLIRLRLYHSVGTHYAVLTVILMSNRIEPVVTAGKIFAGAVIVVAVLRRYFGSESLVHKIPDKSAEKIVISSEHFPVFVEIAEGIAHGMIKLALYIRHVIFSRSPRYHIIYRGIHDARHVDASAVQIRLGMYHPCLICFAYDVGHGVGKYPCCIAFIVERPEEYAGPVLLTCNKRLYTLAYHVVEITHGIGIAYSPVAFHICLSHYENTVFIAQIVHVLVIGVMSRAKCVDVELLHYGHVFFIGLF